MKKILLVLALIPVVASVWIAKSPDLSTCKKQTFIVTWYYSPIEWQTFYYKWSLEADKKLNWQWVRWASGKAVFNWMLAAPKTYEFGTKIYFPWYGMGQVEDRWWAIVTAWNRNYSYDRIDIWLGSWEDWLKRALSFGKRELVWYVCPDGDIGFNMWKFPIYNNLFKDVLWNVTLWVWKTDNNVRTLQTHLKDLGYLTNKEVTGYFGNKTESALCQFQVDVWLLKTTDKLCGYFWPNTGSYMKMAVQWTEIEWIKVLVANKYSNSKVQLVSNKTITDNTKKSSPPTKLMKITSSLTEWVTSYEVRLLQTYLKQISYLTEKEITGIYGPKTKAWVCKFQSDIGILKPTDKMCGSFWPKTWEYLELALSGASIANITNSIAMKNGTSQNTQPKIISSSNQNNNSIVENFTWNIVQWASWDYIQALQNDLIKLWMLKENEIAFTFWPKTKKALCDFQVKIWLLRADDDICWTYWPKTWQVLRLLEAWVDFQELKNYVNFWKNLLDNETYKEILSTKIAINDKDENKDLAVLKSDSQWNKLAQKEIASSINFARWFSLWEECEDIKILQNHLKQMWFYDWKVTWIYDKNTTDWVYQFQLEYNILDWVADPAVKWYFGPKTRSIFTQVISKLVTNQQKQSS